MKVLYYVFFPSGGIGRYTDEFVRTVVSMPGCGIEPEVVCLPEFQWAEGSSYPTWPHLYSISHRFPPLRKARFLVGQVVNPARLVDRVRETRPDVVHLANVNHLTLPLWADKLFSLGVPVAITAHDVRRATAILCRPWEDRQLKALYRRADALFVHGRSQAEDLRTFAGVRDDRVHIVPHGPYDYAAPTTPAAEARRRHRVPTDKPLALFFGRIRDDKNLFALLESLPHVDAPLHLLVAGAEGGRGHWPIDAYRRRVEDLGLGHRVTWLDRFIEDNEVADLFTMADFLVLPYRQSFTSQSGVLNIAGAYRLPVVATPAPLFKETLEDFDIGIVTADESPKAIANGLTAMLDRLAGGHPHAFDAYTNATSWEENVRRTEQVYRALAAARSPAASERQVEGFKLQAVE